MKVEDLRGVVSKDRFDLLGKPSWNKGTCIICGKRATNAHHVVPRSSVNPKRGFTFRDVRLFSPLFGVCGSGTTGCHGLIHQNKIKIRWVWNSERYEPDVCQKTLELMGSNSPSLFNYGYYEITHPSGRKEIKTWHS